MNSTLMYSLVIIQVSTFGGSIFFSSDAILVQILWDSYYFIIIEKSK